MNAADRDAILLRQKDIVRADALEELTVTIIGCGGIGSYTGRTLAQMGVGKAKVYDFDMVEEHNRPNQAYPKDMVGWPKAKALAELMAQYATTNLEVEAVQEAVTAKTKLDGIVISAVDSMPARMQIWQAVKMQMGVPLFIDARMGAEIGQVRALQPFKPSDIVRFEASMEGTPVELPCTARAIVYNAEMISSLIAYAIKEYAMNRPVPAEVVFSFPDMLTGIGLLAASEGAAPEKKKSPGRG